GLDPRARMELWSVLDTLVDRGTTVLLTTQYLEEAERLADDIVVIDHGAVIARGDARKLKRQVGGDHIQVVVTELAHFDDAARILSAVTGAEARPDPAVRSATAPTSGGVGALLDVAWALAEAGIAVDDLSLRQPTLDEVFLTLTGTAPEPPSTQEEPA
ncbi:MAG TPA: daunorubicin/doxorubicin resistance ABC transporter ATP-binding protein DrrA, partial [Acidimicrobiales bacterium]|nr:daunorubicin/doxorubicin resistance ABC transporter ATP-binding protein DrrA [Acidimicrobiales bacterium]